MSIQYAGGTIVNTTFTGATKQNIITAVENNLVTAGWSVVSGSGTADVVLQSATAPTQNTSYRLRCYEPGSGNCARFRLQTSNGSVTTASDYGWLLPGAGKTFTMIANKYQGFVIGPSATTTGREFAHWGMPYMPTHLQGVLTECSYLVGNATGDTDSTARISIRTALNNYNYASIVNGTAHVSTVDNVGIGIFQIAHNGNTSGAVGSLYRWHDDSFLHYDALIGWGVNSYLTEAKIRGQIWDAMVVSQALSAGTTFTFDSRTWYVITDNNAAALRGSLCIAIT